MKLIYFNGRGLVEPTRIMLSIAGAKYEDYRYPIDASYKRPEFDVASAEGAFAIGMNKVPILEVDGGSIAQSKSIHRFVAKRFGFMGTSDLEAGQVDMCYEHVSDIRTSFMDSKAGKSGEEQAAAAAEWLSTKLPEWSAKLEKSIVACRSAGPFAVGPKLSLADIMIFTLFTEAFSNEDAVAKALASCPRVTASIEAAKAASAKWIAERPATLF